MSRRAIAILIGCVAVVAAVVAALPFTPAMPVDAVNVEGSVNLPPAEVESLSGIEVGTPMGRVDVRGAAPQTTVRSPSSFSTKLWFPSVVSSRTCGRAASVIEDATSTASRI